MGVREAERVKGGREGGGRAKKVYVIGGLGITEASCVLGTWAVDRAAGTGVRNSASIVGATSGATPLGKAQGRRNCSERGSQSHAV